MKVKYEKYRELINNDARWLVDNTKNSLERKHILKVLWDSIGCYYPSASQPVVEADAMMPCALCGQNCVTVKRWVCDKCANRTAD